MLSLLRRRMKIILLSLLVLIVPGFILWGVGSALVARKNNFAGYVFNQRISLENYNEINQAVEINNRLRFGRFYDMFKAYLDPNRQTWERLALLTYSKVNYPSLLVFPGEIISNIENNPIFKDEEDGSFSKALFFQITSQYFRIRMPQFEQIVHDDILLDKLTFTHQPTLPVNRAKIEEKILENNRQSQAQLYIAPFKHFELKFEADEDAIVEYYNNNKLNLYSKEKRRVIFLEFDPQLLDFDTIVDDEEALDFYNENASQFRDYSQENSPTLPFEDVRSKVEAQIIQERSRQACLNWAYDVIDSLEEETSLYSAEKSFSMTVQVSPYFESGNQPSNNFINSIQEVAFSMDFSSVSEPILFGEKYYIIQLDDLIPPKEQPLETVRHQITETLKNNFVREQSRQTIFDLQDIGETSKDKDIDSFISELPIEKTETQWLSVSQERPNSDYPQEFLDFLFTSTPQTISSVIEFKEGYGLAICVAHEESTLESLTDEQLKTTRDSLSREENNELSSQWLNSIYKLSQTQTNKRFFNQSRPLDTQQQRSLPF